MRSGEGCRPSPRPRDACPIDRNEWLAHQLERHVRKRRPRRDQPLGDGRLAFCHATGDIRVNPRHVNAVGDAGVGKSRLVAEALAEVEARIVRGRCLPDGDGITYWPVVEVVKQPAVLPSDTAAAAAIRSLLGESEVGTSGDQIAWAVQKLLEEQAPLVAVFDDIQWGDETFLDLVESTALLSAGVPLLLRRAQPRPVRTRSRLPP
jgi:predicted ATPase